MDFIANFAKHLKVCHFTDKGHKGSHLLVTFTEEIPTQKLHLLCSVPFYSRGLPDPKTL